MEVYPGLKGQHSKGMEAYRDKSKPIEKVSLAIESAGNCSSDMLVNVNESSLTDFLKEESKNIKFDP